MEMMYNIIMYMMGTYAIVFGSIAMLNLAYQIIQCIKSPRVDRSVDCKCECSCK